MNRRSFLASALAAAGAVVVAPVAALCGAARRARGACAGWQTRRNADTVRVRVRGMRAWLFRKPGQPILFDFVEPGDVFCEPGVGWFRLNKPFVCYGRTKREALERAELTGAITPYRNVALWNGELRRWQEGKA